MLRSRPKAAAAIAATIRVVKLFDATCANSGASSTPARPANRLDSIHENVLTRSALIPASSVMRGLSTTARICRPMRRPAEERAEHEHGHDGEHDRGRLDGVHRVVAEAVDLVRPRPHGRRAELRALPEPELHDLGPGHEQAERRDQPGDRGRGSEVPVEQPVQHEAGERADDEHREHERGEVGPVVADARVEVDGGGEERLRAEGQVEHAGGLVGEHQTDGHQGEDAPERDAPDDVADQVGQG